MTTIARCPRCRGSLVREWDAVLCLACGHDPETAAPDLVCARCGRQRRGMELTGIQAGGHGDKRCRDEASCARR